jgi:hypothetical protein
MTVLQNMTDRRSILLGKTNSLSLTKMRQSPHPQCDPAVNSNYLATAIDRVMYQDSINSVKHVPCANALQDQPPTLLKTPASWKQC